MCSLRIYRLVLYQYIYFFSSWFNDYYAWKENKKIKKYGERVKLIAVVLTAGGRLHSGYWNHAVTYQGYYSNLLHVFNNKACELFCIIPLITTPPITIIQITAFF